MVMLNGSYRILQWNGHYRYYLLPVMDEVTMQIVSASVQADHAALRTASSRRVRSAVMDTPMGLLQKYVRSQGAQAIGEGSNRCMPIDLEPHEALWEFLTRTVWEADGTRREPGTVLLFADPHGVKVMLNDKDGARVAFSVVDPSVGLLPHLEAMLLSSTTDWRDTRKGGPVKR